MLLNKKPSAEMNKSQSFIYDVIQWDVKNWAKALPFWEGIINDFNGKSAMTFGEREGGLSLWLANKGAIVNCSDYHEFPESTTQLHEKYNVTNSITYSQQDITDIKADDESYDIVMFKSVIGGLGSEEKHRKAIAELHRVLKPGGHLLFAENLEATKFHNAVRKKFTNWSSYWCYPKYKNTEQLLKAFNTIEYKSHGFFGAFGRTEKQRRFLGRIDAIVCPILPNSWKYILFAVAKK